jgi:trk system potassium uptake protein TrkH
MELLFLYVMITGFFVWALNLMGYDLFTSFATVAACINNMGLGLARRRRRSAR